MTWRTSSYSMNHGDCVEAGNHAGAVAVRDSALPGSPVLAFSPAAWAMFTAALKESP